MTKLSSVCPHGAGEARAHEHSGHGGGQTGERVVFIVDVLGLTSKTEEPVSFTPKNAYHIIIPKNENMSHCKEWSK